MIYPLDLSRSEVLPSKDFLVIKVVIIKMRATRGSKLDIYSVDCGQQKQTLLGERNKA